MSNIAIIDDATTKTIPNVVLDTIWGFRIHPGNSHPVRNNQTLHFGFLSTLSQHEFHHSFVVAILSVQCLFYRSLYIFRNLAEVLLVN